MSDRNPRTDPQNGDVFLGEGGFRSVVLPTPQAKRGNVCVVRDDLSKHGVHVGQKLLVCEYERGAFLRWAENAMIYRRAEEL